MKTNSLSAARAVPLLLLCAWPRTSIAQTETPYAVVAWGNNSEGQTAVPVAAQGGVKAIAPGYFHTVALKSDGSVMTWGLNNFLQATVPVAAQSGVTAIAAGPYHTVALKQDGTVVAWGYNGNGEVTGNPTTTAPYSATASPVTLGGQVLSGVTAIAAGGGYIVALKNNGSVVAWGLNDGGQTTVPLAAQSGVTAIAAGVGHTVALKNDGSVVAWGLDDGGQTTVPVAAQSGVAAIAAGERHTVALKNDGSVVVWGDNNFGQTTVPVAAQTGVAAIAAGYAQTFALVIPTGPNITTQPVSQSVNVWQSAAFAVTATGYPLNYQWRKDGVDLAGATSANYSLPFAQTNQAGSYTVVVSNSAGSVTSAPPAVLAVNAAPGAVVAWGRYNSGQMTVPIAAQSGVTAIAAAGGCGFGCNAHTVALKTDGTVVAWGGNSYGQVTGTPTSDAFMSVIASPVTLGGQVLGEVTAVAAGALHTVALKDDGSVVAWGYDGNGEVTGTSATDAYRSVIANPVTLGGQVLGEVTAIAAGRDHTVALKKDGSVLAWGAQKTIPLAAQSGVTAIAAGAYFTVALKDNGSVIAWGRNDWGQTTVPVAAQSGVTAIAAGYGHTVALKNDGSVVAWGYDYQGQVTGSPTIDEGVASPVTLGGHVLVGVTAIAAGEFHTLALKNDGSVVAWGANYQGQVTGTPTIDEPFIGIASPVTLGREVLGGVTAIAAGEHHTVALISGVKLLPSLKARPNGTELILSWPTNAVGFTLQSTLDLMPPVTWLDSTNAPAVIGTQFTLTNTTSGVARFYRLRKM